MTQSTIRPTDDEVHIYTDGSVSVNPGGVGAFAAILICKKEGRYLMKEVARTERKTTNNRMEMRAVILGLCQLKLEIPKAITVFSDSEYVVKGYPKLHRWMAEEKFLKRPNANFWQDLHRITSLLHSKGFDISLKWVKGHAGCTYNLRVDQIARAAMRRALYFKKPYVLDGKKKALS